MSASIKPGSDIVELSDPDRSLTDDQPSTITFDGAGRRIVFLEKRKTTRHRGRSREDREGARLRKRG